MRSFAWILIPALLVGCGQSGSLTVIVSGEESAVRGFDASAFEDGWSVRFDALVVSLGDFALHGASGESALLEQDAILVDLHRGDATAWTHEGVGARRWQDVRYHIRPATEESRVLGELDPALRRRMIDEGLSIYVEARAERAGIVRSIAWGFTSDVQHARCIGADGTDGIIVRAGALNAAELTLHWDHLFFDSLALDDASMRFDAIAAVSRDDRPITLEDLSMQRLADLRDEAGETLRDPGGAPVVYDPGSTPLSEPTLRGMIEAVAITVGHLDGEGHCEYARLR